LNDFAKRFNEELNSGKRCIHMQAYDIGGGQIRYDGVWESGGNKGQSRTLAWALNDFAKRFNEELNSGKRCIHIQAYDIGGGQIRYDGVWESGGNNGQSLALAWALNDFAKRFNEELNSGKHCVHMQAYDIGGGQIRYDGVWESGGNKGQSRTLAWAFNDFIKRCEQESTSGKRLIHLQAYDIGGGQIRYDGVWETAKGEQPHAFGLPLTTFADYFDERTSSGFHVEIMSACLRVHDVPQVSLKISPRIKFRTISFGSDFQNERAFMEPLDMKPLTQRGTGCDLRSAERQ
jgi:hypothetical protein